MKEKIIKCKKCNEDTRQLVFNRYTAGGHNAGKKRRHVEHCTQCNNRVISERRN